MMNPHDLIRAVIAAERACDDAERLGWPAYTHGCLAARAAAYRHLEAAFRTETDALNSYYESFVS